MTEGISRRALYALRRREPSLLELLEAVVLIDSHTSNPAGVEAVAAIVNAELESLGFSVDRFAPSRLEGKQAWIEEVLSPGVPLDRTGASYVATRTGTGAHVLLLGDLDTAFPADEVEQAFEIRGDEAYGPGIADMKGGVVVLVAALQALAATGAAAPTITIVLAGDEQAGSLSSARLIRDAAAVVDLALCMECARDGGKLMGSRAQVGVGQLRAIGREAYAGHDRSAGVNAIDRLVAALAAVVNRPELGHGLVTTTLLRGGRRRSVVPAQAEAIIDLRAPDAETWDRIVAAIGDAAATDDQGAGTIDWRAHPHRPAVPWTVDTDRILARVRALGRELGLDLLTIRSTAAGSSAFAGAAGVPTLDGLGPSGSGLMTRDERIVVDSIPLRAALLAGVLADVAARPDDWPRPART